MKLRAFVIGLSIIISPIFVLGGTSLLIVMGIKAAVAGANTGDPNCIVIPVDTTLPTTDSTSIPESTAAPDETPEGTGAVSIELVLLTIKTKESSGSYTARASKGSASGAYQFTDPTWNNYKGYSSAWLAPPAIQDERARMFAEPLLRQWGLSGVPVGWYYPLALTRPEWMDRVPHPEYGNRLTVRQYQQEWLAVYQQLAGGVLPIDGCNLAGGGGTVGIGGVVLPRSHQWFPTLRRKLANLMSGEEPARTASTVQGLLCAHINKLESTSRTRAQHKFATAWRSIGASTESRQAT
jgi:hypothetical protein